MARRPSTNRGESAIWLAGSGLGTCLLLITGMIALILTNGLGFFWPGPLVRVTLQDNAVLLGEITAREPIPQPGTPEHLKQFRIQLKLGNRDLTGTDFRWVDEAAIARRDYPADATYVERREYGPFIGMPAALIEGDRRIAEGSQSVLQALPRLVRQAEDDRDAIREIEGDGLGEINYLIEEARLETRKLELEAAKTPGRDITAARTALEQQVTALQGRYQQLEQDLAQVIERASRTRILLRAATAPRKNCRCSISSARIRQPADPAAAAARVRQSRGGVPRRRAARVQHRRRHLPGDLRHRDDGADHEHRRGAVRRPGGALSA